mgnify:CR=1 FL=1
MPVVPLQIFTELLVWLTIWPVKVIDSVPFTVELWPPPMEVKVEIGVVSLHASTGFTVTLVDAVALVPSLAVTFTCKVAVSGAETLGAVQFVVTKVGLLNIPAVPAVCVQE